MKYIFIISFLCLAFHSIESFGQLAYTIDGKNNLIKEGSATLSLVAPGQFYSVAAEHDTVRISNYRFSLTGRLLVAQRFRMELFNSESKFISEPFFIDSGFQKIVIDSSANNQVFMDFGFGVTLEGSRANDEFTTVFAPLLKITEQDVQSYFHERSECTRIADESRKQACVLETETKKWNYRRQRDSILCDYVSGSPSSPIVQWLLYDAISTYGYNDFYQQSFDSIKNHLSVISKTTIENVLKMEKTKSPGQIFPLTALFAHVISDREIADNAYTLVDFWFSSCGPCIAQFEHLRSIYQEYKKSRFEIMAISTDSKETMPAYNKVLKAKLFPWKQILDTAGIMAKVIDIHKYPSNFLLDSNGKILLVDVDPIVLRDFLKRNL